MTVEWWDARITFSIANEDVDCVPMDDSSPNSLFADPSGDETSLIFLCTLDIEGDRWHLNWRIDGPAVGETYSGNEADGGFWAAIGHVDHFDVSTDSHDFTHNASVLSYDESEGEIELEVNFEYSEISAGEHSFRISGHVWGNF